MLSDVRRSSALGKAPVMHAATGVGYRGGHVIPQSTYYLGLQLIAARRHFPSPEPDGQNGYYGDGNGRPAFNLSPRFRAFQ
jgi:hypothetical protein